MEFSTPSWLRFSRGLQWVNDGSHYVQDDLYVSMDQGAVQSYLRVFHLIFNLSEHESHYKMMMGDAYSELEQVPDAATAAEEVPTE